MTASSMTDVAPILSQDEVQHTLRVFFRKPRSDVALIHPMNSRVTYCRATQTQDKHCGTCTLPQMGETLAQRACLEPPNDA